MRREMLALLLIGIALLGSAVTYVTFTRGVIIDRYTTDVRFEIVEEPHIAFELNSTVLAFGTVSLGGGAEKRVILTSPARSRVDFTYSEGIDGFISTMPDPLVLEADVPKNVTFTLAVPQDAVPGNYTGTLTAVYVRLLPWQSS